MLDLIPPKTFVRSEARKKFLQSKCCGSCYGHIYKNTKLQSLLFPHGKDRVSEQAQRHTLFNLHRKSVHCVCIRLDSVLLSLPIIPHMQPDTIVPLERTRQPPVAPSPSKAHGTIPLHTKPRPLLTCVARLACTLVAIDFVDAPPVVTGFALAVIQVHLTVESCRSTHV